MIKKSFLGLKKPRFEYEAVSGMPTEPESIPTPEKVTLFLNKAFDGKSVPVIKTGDAVKTGQKLAVFKGSDAYVISSVTGTVDAITPATGDFGQELTAVTIKTSGNEEIDGAFEAALAEKGEDVVKDFLAGIPGGLPLDILFNSACHTDTVVICGVEKDLLMTGNQYAVKTQGEAIGKGISVLKKAAGIHKAVIVIPQYLMQEASAIGGASGVELRVIGKEYPAASPRMILKEVMGQAIPAEKTCEEAGICFISAQAVAAVGQAFMEKKIPVAKTVRLINGDLNVTFSAPVGTPLSEIFKTFGVTLYEGDRIILGGPMTGKSVWSEDAPVEPDTDLILVQGGAEISEVSDYPCINCGECVRICPANVPVNMLVRFLEFRDYETAAVEYDLYSCVECGLCSYVCVAKIPVFQYIRLAKYELDQVRIKEEAADA